MDWFCFKSEKCEAMLSIFASLTKIDLFRPSLLSRMLSQKVASGSMYDELLGLPAVVACQSYIYMTLVELLAAISVINSSIAIGSPDFERAKVRSAFELSFAK